MLPLVSTYDAIEALYRGDKITRSWLIESSFELEKYNEFHKKVDFSISDDGSIEQIINTVLKNPNDTSLEELISDGLKTWIIPEEFLNLNIRDYINDKVTDENKDRVEKELSMFDSRGLTPVLQFMVYFVETMRKHNIVWGVGRGSSVSSYVLFLIGIHKIDSIKYNLDIEDFLK